MKTQSLTKLGLIFIGLSSISTSYAQDIQLTTDKSRTGFFLAPAAGVMLNNATGYHDSPEFTFSFGYSFSSYFSLKAGSILFYSRSDNGDTKKLGNYLRADVVFSLPTQTKWTPYLFGGIGSLKFSSSEFAPNIGTGIAYSVLKNYALTANYRAIIPTKTNGMINLFDIGFIHYF